MPLLGALGGAHDRVQRVAGIALDERTLVERAGLRGAEAVDVALQLLGAHAVGGALAAGTLELAAEGGLGRGQRVEELLLLADVVLKVLDLGLSLAQVTAVLVAGGWCCGGARGGALGLVELVLHPPQRAVLLRGCVLGLLSGLVENLLQHELLVLEVAELHLQVLDRLGCSAFGLAAARLEVLDGLLRRGKLVSEL